MNGRILFFCGIMICARSGIESLICQLMGLLVVGTSGRGDWTILITRFLAALRFGNPLLPFFI